MQKPLSSFSLALCAAAAAGPLVGACRQAAAAAPAVQTVFVIAMENHDWTQANPTGGTQQILNNPAAPFINSLIVPNTAASAQVSYTTNYLNAGVGVHPSEPNYLWAEAGTNFNKDTNTTILADSDPSAAAKNIFVNTPHLTGQMNATGVSWNNYQEDYQILNPTTPTGGSVQVSKSGTSSTVTNPYYNTNQYNYAVKHDPMAFFTDTATQNVKTFDSLRSDIAADTFNATTNPTPTNNFGKYNWITPNQFNDMHSSITGTFTYHGTAFTGDQSAIATGDNYLATIVPQIMATDAYKNNGAIVLWWDETESTDTAATTLPEIIISPLAKGNGYTNTITYDHSSDIKTMEEIFQLGGMIDNTIPNSETLGGSSAFGSVTNSTDLSDLFQSGVIPTAVPEPASLGLLCLGAMAALARRRRRTV